MNKCLIAALWFTSIAVSPLFASPNDEPSRLPQVLIIGDSISIGYTPHVQQILRGKAVVRHHRGNAQHTGTGLQQLDQWLGQTKWDLIHFNWGLWDLCYRHPGPNSPENRDKVNGTVTTTLAQYRKNLESLVSRLKATGARLIWANTTVIPEGEPGRKVGDDLRYNHVASQVMKAHGIAITDLYAQTKDFPSNLFIQSGDVHYTEEGYRIIALRVSEKILTAIETKE